MALVTFDQLNEFFEDTSESIIQNYVEPINEVMEFYEINNKNRISMFLAQVGHESGGLSVIKENLNYSADRLKVIFPKYFRGVDPSGYARNPQKIANRVYASRMGNGSEESGDGWRFCGRGLIQVTGRDNYSWFAASLHISPEEASEYMETFEGAAQSACWFWESNNLNQWADKRDILTLTKRINGGTIGLEDRKKHYEHCLHILGQ